VARSVFRERPTESWSLRRDRTSTDSTLFLTGRDIEEREIAIAADVAAGIFRELGPAAARRISRERDEILALLERHPNGLRPRDIADLLGKSQNATRALLWKMTDDGQVTTDMGRYERKFVDGVDAGNGQQHQQRLAFPGDN